MHEIITILQRGEARAEPATQMRLVREHFGGKPSAWIEEGQFQGAHGYRGSARGAQVS